MLAGDKLTFAIESVVRERIADFVYCNFRFWIAGEPIGDWDDELVLGVLVHSADIFLLYQGDRCLDIANNMDADLLWQHIEKVANSDDPEDLRLSLEGHYRQRYLLHEIATDSVASVCKIFVVERSDGIQRLLWKRKVDSNTQEIRLPQLSVDQVVTQFLEWAKEQ